MTHPQAQSGPPSDVGPQLPHLEPTLTPDDLTRIERHLIALETDLRAGIARLQAEPASATTPRRASRARRGPRDRATPLAVLRGELQQATRALARLKSGTYGLCQVCGRPIAPRRLAIIPSAERCDECARPATPEPTAH